MEVHTSKYALTFFADGFLAAGSFALVVVAFLALGAETGLFSFEDEAFLVTGLFSLDDDFLVEETLAAAFAGLAFSLVASLPLDGATFWI